MGQRVSLRLATKPDNLRSSLETHMANGALILTLFLTSHMHLSSCKIKNSKKLKYFLKVHYVLYTIHTILLYKIDILYILMYLYIYVYTHTHIPLATLPAILLFRFVKGCGQLTLLHIGLGRSLVSQLGRGRKHGGGCYGEGEKRRSERWGVRTGCFG